MGVLPVHEGRGRRRALDGLLFLLCLLFLFACSLPSSKKQSREEILRRDVRSFHWALIRQDAPVALRFVPGDDRDPWDESFACLFRQLRLLEYRVEHVRFGEDSNEASVRVRWTVHPPDSLVVKEVSWREEWAFQSKKRRWSITSSRDAIKGLPTDCLPKVTGGEDAEGEGPVNGRHRSGATG